MYLNPRFLAIYYIDPRKDIASDFCSVGLLEYLVFPQLQGNKPNEHMISLHYLVMLCLVQNYS